MSKAKIIHEFHEDFGVTLTEAEKAYNIAAEYLRLRAGGFGDHPEQYTPPEYALTKLRRDMRDKQFPSAQSEQPNCEYCHEDVDGYVTSIEKNNHAFVRFGMNGWELSLKANGWHGSAKIRYCPMCGRRLKRNDKR